MIGMYDVGGNVMIFGVLAKKRDSTKTYSLVLYISISLSVSTFAAPRHDLEEKMSQADPASFHSCILLHNSSYKALWSNIASIVNSLLGVVASRRDFTSCFSVEYVVTNKTWMRDKAVVFRDCVTSALAM